MTDEPHVSEESPKPMPDESHGSDPLTQPRSDDSPESRREAAVASADEGPAEPVVAPQPYAYKSVTAVPHPAASPTGLRVSTTSVLWRRSWIVLIGAVVIALLTYLVSKQLTPVYASTADVSVVVTGQDPEDSSLGANSLASQYAQEASATTVLVDANRALARQGLGSVPTTAISSGVVAAQNIIAIRVTASSASLARIRAAAVTNAFIAYVTSQVNSIERKYEASSQRELKPLNAQIASVTKQLKAAGPDSSDELSLENTLSALVSSRASATSSIAETSNVDRPTISPVTAAGVATKTSPKPPLYAAVAFVIALLLLARLVTLIGLDRYRPR